MPTKPWRELRRGGDDAARVERIEAIKDAMRDAMALAELRERRGVTQVELARRLGTAQSGVSRIEHRDDVYLSTLREYVEALGGRLEVSAVFEGERVTVATWERTLEPA
jgi:transcriptional regulator with XRE-family HTH domain